MLLSKAIEGYFFDKSAVYSKNTLASYVYVYRNLVDYLGDKDIEAVTPEDLTAFITHIRTDYIPIRFGGDTSPLSNAGVDLHWKGTRSLFKWASETLGFKRPDLNMPRPKFKRPHVRPFTEDDIRKLIRHCDYTVDKSHRGASAPFRQRRPTAKRDKALILVLLDTGLRIGELLRLKIEEVNFEEGELLIAPFGTGRKTKPRLVVIGTTARRSLWLYVASLQHSRLSDRLFPMTQNAVRLLLSRLGDRAGVNDVHPHRFRHSFAIHYLRNGGDIFTLQRLLGHSTLEMVNYYLDIAQSDIALAHRKASAIDRWNATRPF